MRQRRLFLFLPQGEDGKGEPMRLERADVDTHVDTQRGRLNVRNPVLMASITAPLKSLLLVFILHNVFQDSQLVSGHLECSYSSVS